MQIKEVLSEVKSLEKNKSYFGCVEWYKNMISMEYILEYLEGEGFAK